MHSTPGSIYSNRTVSKSLITLIFAEFHSRHASKKTRNIITNWSGLRLHVGWPVKQNNKTIITYTAIVMIVELAIIYAKNHQSCF